MSSTPEWPPFTAPEEPAPSGPDFEPGTSRHQPWSMPTTPPPAPSPPPVPAAVPAPAPAPAPASVGYAPPPVPVVPLPSHHTLPPDYPINPAFPPATFGPPPVAYSQPPLYPPGFNAPLADGLQVAAYWRRVMARLIDAAIAVAGIVVMNLALGDRFATLVTRTSGSSYNTTYLFTPLGIVLTLVLGFVLEVVAVCTLGGQLGKLLMGLRIARARDLRTPVGWGHAIGRWLILGAAFALCFVPGLLFSLSPLWNQPYRRGWHDRMVDTIVTERVSSPIGR